MGRRKSVAGGRPHVVAVRLSKAEKAELDAKKGPLDAGMFLRLALRKAPAMGLPPVAGEDVSMLLEPDTPE